MEHFTPQLWILLKRHLAPQLVIMIEQHFAFELPNHHQLSSISFSSHYNPKFFLKTTKSLLILNFDEQLTILCNKKTKEEGKKKG